MRTLHVDSDRHQWISTGNVEAVAKWADVAGRRQRLDEQDTGPTGLPLWVVEVIAPPEAGDERARTEIVRITVPAPATPDVGAFGTLLQFEGMTAAVWPSKDGRNVQQSFTATGVRPAGAATGRPARQQDAA